MSPRPLITLTTDFGCGSPYVAQMKGVILSLCREIDLIDITHAIAPQNIREGAVVIADVAPRLPSGTIHVVVVDPGVGTSRKLVYAEIEMQRFVAPDNGVLSLLASKSPPDRIVSLENRAFWLPEPSHTFHGRDILAPVAAHLASGVHPAELGPRLDSLVLLDWPRPQKSPSGISGQVLYVDSFGNLITNIGRDDLSLLGDGARLTIECGGKTISGLCDSYSAVVAGQLMALFDSQGRLEIAVSGGNAARELSAAEGAEVRIHSSV